MLNRIVGKEIRNSLSSYRLSIARVLATLELIVEKEMRHNLFSYKFSIITILTTILILVKHIHYVSGLLSGQGEL